MLTTTLALLLQVGINPQASPVTAVPPELDELRRRQRGEQTEILQQRDRLESCLQRADQDSTAARTEADAWLGQAVGLTRAQALQCRGYAEANLGRWGDAANSFLAARDEEAVSADTKYRARLAAMAANALITGGDMRKALGVLETADSDALSADFAQLRGEIALDRARAMVAIGDMDGASSALKSARGFLPRSARAWLLSATLARRQDDLVAAQSYIEQSAALDPLNAEVGLEAGVIAVLEGKEDSARKSWQSVIKLAPDSVQAQTAQTYLRQLDQS